MLIHTYYNMRPVIISIVAAAALGCSMGSASANTIFFDDFNTDNGGHGALNFNGFKNWTISDGTVDLIGEGTSWNYVPKAGYGLYVDLDGSTQNAGVMTSKQSFSFEPGFVYTLSFDLAGNNLPGNSTAYPANDSARVTVFLETGNTVLMSQDITKFRTDSFQTYSLSYSVANALSAPVKLRFEGLAANGVLGDNVGLLLDNVKLFVPEGGSSLVLAGLGFLAVVGFAWNLRQEETRPH